MYSRCNIFIVITSFFGSAVVLFTDLKSILNSASDAAVPYQRNFQTPATEVMEKIVDLHHDLMFFITVIVMFVS